VDLSVGAGECLGLIGPNGSGKSTLLRLMAGIFPPTEGRLEVDGRVAPMIELGVGFHPDLTGCENVYLNTSLFGLPRGETDRLYDSIVEFSGLAAFMDMPVKAYSSGMYMRLGFAVTIHLDADVLLIDEILAVGDEAFHQKCIERLHRIRTSGRTIVLVSHDLALVERICDRVGLLVGGRILAEGKPGAVIERYHEVARALG
jgi:ABC-type polysaccharide/polyol phosphate transport system ATPase subunit